MRIYVKKIPVKFHPNPIRNDGALGFFEDGRPNNKKKKKKNNNKMSSDTKLVPHLKTRQKTSITYCFNNRMSKLAKK